MTGMIEEAIKEKLARPDSDCAILRTALLNYLRASRRAKLAEVAALERFEAALTIQRASQPSEEITSRALSPHVVSPASSARHSVRIRSG